LDRCLRLGDRLQTVKLDGRHDEIDMLADSLRESVFVACNAEPS
jgi:hypothetical protein